jgi:hypothetical protein
MAEIQNYRPTPILSKCLAVVVEVDEAGVELGEEV